MRRTFTLATAAIANIIVRVDDDYDLFINGVLIGGNHDGGAGGDRYTDVPLLAGLNVLAITVSVRGDANASTSKSFRHQSRGRTTTWPTPS